MNTPPRVVPALFLICGLSTGWAAAPGLHFEQQADVPPPPGQDVSLGLAGAYAGSIGTALLAGGGANFPDRPPWEGGTKQYYDEVYLMTAPGATWERIGQLPHPMAYGTSLVTPQGLLLAGGEQDGALLNQVYLLTLDLKKPVFTELPVLPESMKGMGGGCMGSTVYLVGGKTPDGFSRRGWKLDLNRLDQGWQALPEMPGAPRHNAPTAVAGGRLYVFGGLSFSPEVEEPFIGRDVLCFDPGVGTWSQLGPIALPGHAPRAVCAGSAGALDDRWIVLTGGRGDQNLAPILKTLRARNQAREQGDAPRLAQLEKEVDIYFTGTRFRFNPDVLLFDTHTGSWHPGPAFPSRPTVTAPLTRWQTGLVLVSGEIRPGVRTPEVWHLVPGASPVPKRPDIVLLMADDLGYSDLGCYGGEIRTPRIDQLAEQGLRFSQFYNAGRCCPSRASLLTGLHPHRAGIGHMVSDRGLPGYQGRLGPHTVTIAEVLRSAGYTTAMAGKWHVTDAWKDTSDRSCWPRQRGFDQFYGTLPGHGSLWDPAGLVDDNAFVEPEGDYYYTEVLADRAVQTIRQTAETDRNLFLYVAFTAPHYPLHARGELIDSYQGVYDRGWDQGRTRRHQALLDLGLLPPGTALGPRDEQVPPWEQEPYPVWQALRMQTYAAMVEHMDRAVGRIVDALAETGRLDNTLLVFLSDNGGSPEGHLYNRIERLDRPWSSALIPPTTRDGRTVWPGDWPGVRPGSDTTYPSYGIQWAHLSNTPFRRHKHWLHEGGIAAPFIVHWPDRIRAPGSLRHEVTHILDLLPTCLDAAGATYPAERAGHAIDPYQGVSLLSVLNGAPVKRDTPLCWEHEGNRAIRDGRWKLVSEYPGSWKGVRRYAHQGRWELYDMAVDRTETRDLAASCPDRVQRMAQTWQHWADANRVVDWARLSGEEAQRPD